MLPFNPEFITRNLVNCFIGNIESPEYNNHIFLLYEFSGDKWFIKFEKELSSNPLFIAYMDVDYKHVIYIFNVPEEYKEEYLLFKEGKYSKFAKDYKDRILNFHNSSSESSIIKVLSKSEDQFKAIEKYFDIKIPRHLEASSKPYLLIPDGWTIEDVEKYRLHIEVFHPWMKKNKPNQIQPENKQAI